MLPGAGFHRCQPNQSKRNPAICEIQTHAVFTGKVAAWQGFLEGTSAVAIPAVCSMAVLHYLSITSVFDSTLPSQKFINSIAGLSGLTSFTPLLPTRFFHRVALRSRSAANHGCNEETLALDGRLVPRAMK